MTATQAAEALGITPGAVRDAIARGALAALRTGGSEKKAGHLLIMKDEVERYRREQAGKMGAASPRHSRIGNRHPRKPAPGIQSHMPPDEPIAPDDLPPPSTSKRRDDTR